MTAQSENSRINLLKKASIVGMLCNALLAIIKLVAGLKANSLSVIGDGADSITDVATYSVGFITALILSRPPDIKYPFGYRRAEALGTKILAFIIVFAGFQLGLEAFKKLLSNHNEAALIEPLAIYATLISIVGKALLAWWQHKQAIKSESSLLMANSQNMLADMTISSLVLIGLIISYYFKITWIDSVLALAVSIWIIKVGIGFVIETSAELLDRVQDVAIYDEIIAAVDTVPEATNPHRIRARRIGRLYTIDLDIEVNGQMSVKESHDIAIKVEKAIKDKVENVYDIMTHIEPLGNHEPDEKFGVSADETAKRDQ